MYLAGRITRESRCLADFLQMPDVPGDEFSECCSPCRGSAQTFNAAPSYKPDAVHSLVLLLLWRFLVFLDTGVPRLLLLLVVLGLVDGVL